MGGAVDSSGNPSGCTNLGKWVFTKRLTVGNSAVRASAVGTPTGATLSAAGAISATDYCTKPGAVSTFNSIKPYTNTGGVIKGLPSGEILYIAEAGAAEYVLPPYTGGSTYALGLF